MELICPTAARPAPQGPWEELPETQAEILSHPVPSVTPGGDSQSKPQFTVLRKPPRGRSHDSLLRAES